MSKCVEIDGPGLAMFYDGENLIEYETFALSVMYPKTANDLVLAFERLLDRIRDQSDIIYWRVRPTINFGQKHVSDPDGLVILDDAEWFEEYLKGNEIIRMRCRLACYPPWRSGEMEGLGVQAKEEGEPVQML